MKVVIGIALFFILVGIVGEISNRIKVNKNLPIKQLPMSEEQLYFVRKELHSKIYLFEESILTIEDLKDKEFVVELVGSDELKESINFQNAIIDKLKELKSKLLYNSLNETDLNSLNKLIDRKNYKHKILVHKM